MARQATIRSPCPARRYHHGRRSDSVPKPREPATATNVSISRGRGCDASASRRPASSRSIRPVQYVGAAAPISTRCPHPRSTLELEQTCAVVRRQVPDPAGRPWGRAAASSFPPAHWPITWDSNGYCGPASTDRRRGQRPPVLQAVSRSSIRRSDGEGAEAGPPELGAITTETPSAVCQRQCARPRSSASGFFLAAPAPSPRRIPPTRGSRRGNTSSNVG
jgi:hypothetical protein